MPIDVSCPECNTAFRVNDEFAGKKVRCNVCDVVIQLAGIPQVPDVPFSPDLDPVFHEDKFLLHQKLMTINTKYVVLNGAGNEIMYVNRPTFLFRQLLAVVGLLAALILLIPSLIISLVVLQPKAGDIVTGILVVVGAGLVILAGVFVWAMLVPKRHILFYRDEKQQQLLLEILQDKKFAFYMASYTVRTANGETLGQFKKDYFAGLLRKRWDGFDAVGKQILIIREDSIVLSLLRRVMGSFYGLLRTNFLIFQATPDGKDGTFVGEFNRKFTLFDRYVLDCTHDRTRILDRRMAMALGVLLDTGEGR